MTRKDYEKIAEALRLTESRDRWEAWSGLVERIADILAADNERFDRARFKRACGWVE